MPCRGAAVPGWLRGCADVVHGRALVRHPEVHEGGPARPEAGRVRGHQHLHRGHEPALWRLLRKAHQNLQGGELVEPQGGGKGVALGCREEGMGLMNPNAEWGKGMVNAGVDKAEAGFRDFYTGLVGS